MLTLKGKGFWKGAGLTGEPGEGEGLLGEGDNSPV